MPIQIDMEMPRSCYVCPLFNREWWCCNLPFVTYDTSTTEGYRNKDCPLKEVKE